MLLAARNRLDAELARTVREADGMGAAEHDGLKTMASWLRGHGRLSPAAAARMVRPGRAAEQLPAVAAGWSDGVITDEHAATIGPIVTPEKLSAAVEHDIDLAAVDAVLAETAATRPYEEL